MNKRFLMYYDEWFDDVYRFVLYKTGNRWDTDDLVSEVFRKAYQHMHTHQKDIASPKHWLITIARHTVIDYYRKKKDILYGHDPEVTGYTQTVELLTELEVDPCLSQSLAMLTPEEKEMINLKYVVGLSYAEISEVIAQTDHWIKLKVHRLKQKLARLITKCREVQS